MLPIATVKWTRNEFTAQASDDVWFRLAFKADQEQLGGISQRIRVELAKPPERGQRRITFPAHEAEPIIRMIEQG